MFSTTHRHLKTLTDLLETTVATVGDGFDLQICIGDRTDVYADGEWCVIGDSLSITMFAQDGEPCINLNWTPTCEFCVSEQRIPLAEIAEACLESGKNPGEAAETFFKTLIQACGRGEVIIPIEASSDENISGLESSYLN